MVAGCRQRRRRTKSNFRRVDVEFIRCERAARRGVDPSNVSHSVLSLPPSADDVPGHCDSFFWSVAKDDLALSGVHQRWNRVSGSLGHRVTGSAILAGSGRVMGQSVRAGV